MKFSVNLRAYSNLGSMISKLVFDNWQYVLFLFALLLFYIANALYAEGKVRRIQSLQKELKAVHGRCMRMQIDLMERSRKKNVMEEVKSQDLYLSNERRKRIIIDAE